MSADFPHQWYLHLLPLARLDGPTSRTHIDELARLATALEGRVLEAGRPFSLLESLGNHADSVHLDVLARLASAMFELGLRMGFRIDEHHVADDARDDGRALSLPAPLVPGRCDLVMTPLEGPVRLGVAVDGNVLRLTVNANDAATRWTRLESASERVVHGARGLQRELRIRRRFLEAGTERELAFDEITIRRTHERRPPARRLSAA